MARDDPITLDWRAPALVRGGLASLAATALIALAWALLAGTGDRRLDDLGIYTGMLAGLPAAAGAIAAACRQPETRGPGARLILAGQALLAMLAVAAAQCVLLLVMSAFDELVWVALGAVIGCLAVALPGAILAMLAGAPILWATRSPPGSGPLHRSLMGLLLLSVFTMAIGAALGSTATIRSGDVGGAIAILLGFEGEVASAPWLWAARASAIAFVVLLVAVRRAQHRN